MVNERQAQGVSFRLGLHEVKGSAAVEEYAYEACYDIYIYISIVTNEEGLSSFDLGHQADED